MAEQAEKIIAANGLSDRITVVAKRVEDVQDDDIPPNSVDVIVSEWMGYSLLYVRSGGAFLNSVLCITHMSHLYL